MFTILNSLLSLKEHPVEDVLLLSQQSLKALYRIRRTVSLIQPEGTKVPLIYTFPM